MGLSGGVNSAFIFELKCVVSFPTSTSRQGDSFVPIRPFAFTRNPSGAEHNIARCKGALSRCLCFKSEYKHQAGLHD